MELVTIPEHPLDPHCQSSAQIDPASQSRLLPAGSCGFSTLFLENDCDGYYFVQILECHILSALRGYSPDGLDDAIQVDPWPD